MIAISYRREDSLPTAGRLYDRLQAKFGKKNVFMDFDSIRPGVDFRERIRHMIERSKVVVAIIGPHWFGERPDASRRIDNPADFVRFEIACALKRGIPIIPVLVNNTPMPSSEKLPEEIKELAFRNAVTLDTGMDFNHHANRLIAGILKELREPTRIAIYTRSLRKGFILGAAILLALAALATWLLVKDRHEQDSNATRQPVGVESPRPAPAEFSIGPTFDPTPTTEPSGGIVAWWPAEGNADDIIGGNDGTAQNGVTFDAGKVGRAFRFNGVDDYVLIPTLVDNWPQGTIEGWVNYVSARPGADGSFIFAATERKPLTGHWDLTILGIHPKLGIGTDLGFGIYSGGWQWAASGITPIPGRWYHVAGTWGSKGIRIYINGVLRRTYPYVGPTPRASFNIIGASSWPRSSVNAFVDELSIYNSVLSDAEIKSIYDAGTAGKRRPEPGR